MNTAKRKVVLATGNQDKVKEMADVLSQFGFDVIAQSELGIESPEETGLTFIENALLKARYAAKLSGLPAIADDSGLAVDALGGEPGLYSARYAGLDSDYQANRRKLLQAMENVPDEQRQAKFITCIAFLEHETDPVPKIAIGEHHGTILREERGENGFGYDPIFFSPQCQCTFAELDSAEKKRISHRAIALAKLQAQL